MNTNQQEVPSNESPRGEKRGCCGRGPGRRRGGALFVLVAALAIGAAGGYVGKTFAQGPFGGRMGMGGPMSVSGPIDPAKVDSQVERMIKHFAVEVDATPAQRDKLTVIAKAAAKDLLPLRDKLQAGHKQAIELMGGQNVDRAGMEKLRVEQIALADTASKRVTQALGDAADVLTPAQRQKLAERMKERGEHRPFWHRG
jgi:Spy/CpxP family protein refolding chaperone